MIKTLAISLIAFSFLLMPAALVSIILDGLKKTDPDIEID
jgi:hypothetical protein